MTMNLDLLISKLPIAIQPTVIKYKQFLIYSFIGVSGAGLDLILFLIFVNIFKWDKNVSTFISTSAGIINNFIWNSIFNFKLVDKIWERFIKFYGIGLTGFFLTLLIFWVFIDKLGFNTNLIKILSIFAVVLMQYNLNKKISFKN